jgi:hypothetical protein
MKNYILFLTRGDFKNINKQYFKNRFNRLTFSLNKKVFLFSDGHCKEIRFFISIIFRIIFQPISVLFIKGRFLDLYSGFIFISFCIVFGGIEKSKKKTSIY